MIITADGKIGVNKSIPSFSVDINTVDGIKIPVGSDSQRPNYAVKGLLRYNTSSDQFEGFGSGEKWGTLGGVRDVNGDTYISAETFPGDNNDELRFYTNSNLNMIITDDGKIGVGFEVPSFKIDVNGEINASGFNINGTPFKLEFPIGMALQTKHLTYTDTRTKNEEDTDWVAIDNDLTSGFVIKIKPSHIKSKILLNLVCHIGMDYLYDSRWWGLKLYRKIGTGEWQEISGANGTGNNNGSACWISHNLGADSSIYSHSITNVSGSYEDNPETTEYVYYTVYWKSCLNGSTGKLYLNKSAETYDNNYPKPSSCWTAIEIWNDGVPYVPPQSSSTIDISGTNVGIGMKTSNESLYKLNINGNVNIDDDNFKYTINGRDIINDTSNYIKDTSNFISTRITNLNTDYLNEGTTNKYIVDNTYNYDLKVNGTLTINSNLTVLGETSYLYTNLYTTEQLSVINESQGVAFNLIQNDDTYSILNVSNIQGQVFNITNSGNVGIGILNPDNYKLYVDGNIKCNSLFQTSDKRYKINIELIDDTLELINKISPISYTTIHDNYKKYGFIAQEIEEIFPNVVNKPENKDELYSIDYISIIPLLTKSIQELTIIVNNQQKELNYLKTKL